MLIKWLEEEADYLAYLPPVLQNIREFQELAKAVNPEIIALKKAINKVLNEQFIQSAEDTLQWREKEFNITASSDETIEFRRERLIERKSRKPPITLRSLRNRLNAYIGTTQAEIELVPGEYAFSISIPAVDGYKFRDIQRLVEELKPANMEYLQFPFSVERIRIKEESREIKIFYARAGLAIAGRTRIGTTLSERVVYRR
ncbi:MAG TPA: DUF2313 domain-containing protein [Hungateiclostridium thermocellum]|uniref:DUF2313 domain-containing protein n=1 Tax=Acetivibrio thermocellus (strain ATCC 27405 / DSM 1237 / JCM 9322 / NBRC 103400 / NCIMB 10682 / NRRL B-4536 / VPI 7372) TaxID=203119 RepID=A3DIB6_ACET2|nr:YmfQ family protein [Acetivibrio thermocellus]ABN53695.1 conserved hypothetical protein; putative PBSX prophage protein [Acetivibrio thermocellus ATCC 27405]HBW25716.1 DUF2313 domain-containing protein [Acetivibrio thermocellus]